MPVIIPWAVPALIAAYAHALNETGSRLAPGPAHLILTCLP